MFSQFGLSFGKLAMQLFNRAVIADFFGRTVCFLDRKRACGKPTFGVVASRKTCSFTQRLCSQDYNIDIAKFGVGEAVYRAFIGHEFVFVVLATTGDSLA